MKNKNLKDIIKSKMNLGKDALGEFMELLELPDSIFDATYPAVKARITEMFESPEVQQSMISYFKNNPIEDIDSLRKELPEFIGDITDDETLSANKKDFIYTIFDNMITLAENIGDGSGREFVSVKITKLNPEAIIPQYAHPTDAGADICAVEETTIMPGETKIVKTGLAVAIPVGYEIQVRPRSGLSLKSGLRIANAPGTIDTDYRGEIGIIMTNTKDIPYVIDKGMKIAQLIISRVPRIKWREVDNVEALGTTDRGNGGFGSTGIKS